ncbi:hydroxyproline dehydrogenase-like [Watersipora subatra]|uniref:hydroxyproline dehydrogenase-like n=1 Tax=Watersipora subatra TaxID=2589382 RepID=UPI00355C63EB
MQGLMDESSPHEKYMQIRLTAFLCTPVLTELSAMTTEEREKLSHDAADYMNSLGSSKSLQWLSSKCTSEAMLEELKEGLRLLADVGKKAKETNTVLMIDAEYISINPAITSLALALALICNTDSAVVWNTTQCYLKKSYHNIQEEFKFAKANKIHYGAKVVRGAYIVPEGEAARLGGYPSPVHDSYEDTNRSYDRIVDWLLTEISHNTGKRSVRFILASHNKKSIQQAILRMNDLNIKLGENKVMFGQIYGMYDYITYALSKAGHPAVKSMAVGSVSDALPYLSRRSQENSAVIDGANEGRQLLKLEVLRRMRIR